MPLRRDRSPVEPSACFAPASGRPFSLRSLDATEAQILASILAYLKRDRRVAWVERFNVGAARVTEPGGRERFIRFAFRGCSDLLGQLVDGRVLAIEVKTRTGRVRPEQADFIGRVQAGRGVGLVARSVDDVIAAINAAGVATCTK